MGKHEGMVVFVPGTIVGELCEVKIIKVNKNISHARLERIINSSENRIENNCTAYPACGGCTFRHMKYSAELEFKRSKVKEALKRIGGTDIDITVTPSPNIDRYRNKVMFPVCQTNSIGYGFFRRHSHDIVLVSDCKIQSETANALAKRVCDFLNRHNISIYNDDTKKGLVREIYIRSGETVQLCLVINGEHLPHCGALIEEVKDVAGSIVLNVNKTAGNTLLGDKFINVYGNDYITDTLCGLNFFLSPASFYQVNKLQAENLYKKAIEFAEIDKTKTVYELFCGIGTISLIMAKKAKYVTGVEISPSAVADAEENARFNGIENVSFQCQDASS